MYTASMTLALHTLISYSIMEGGVFGREGVKSPIKAFKPHLLQDQRELFTEILTNTWGENTEHIIHVRTVNDDIP